MSNSGLVFTYLSDTEEEPYTGQLGPVLSGGHKHGEAAPEYSKSWKKEAGSYSGEDHVGRDFADEIGDEEDEHDDRILARG